MEKTTNITFKMIVDSSAEAKIYPITITTTYEDVDNNKYTTTTTIAINVIDKKEPKVKVFFVSIKPEPYSTGNSELTVDIANIGSEKAYSVVLEAETPSGIIQRNSYYIGDLNTDDFSTVDLDIAFKNISSGSYPVNFDISYHNENDKEISSRQSFNITLMSYEEALKKEPKQFPLFEASMILIIILIIIWYIRKRLKKKK